MTVPAAARTSVCQIAGGARLKQGRGKFTQFNSACRTRSRAELLRITFKQTQANGWCQQTQANGWCCNQYIFGRSRPEGA